MGGQFGRLTWATNLGLPTRAANSGRSIRTAYSGGQFGRPTRAVKVAHGGHKVPTGGLTNGGCEKDFLKNLLTNPLKHPLDYPSNNFLKNRLKNPLNGGIQGAKSGRAIRAANSGDQFGVANMGGQLGWPFRATSSVQT